MSLYLSATELAELVGCKPNSRACMRRWLESNKWPYATNRVGFPQVARTYYDARMSGTLAAPSIQAAGPDREALLKRLTSHGRQKKAA